MKNPLATETSTGLGLLLTRLPVGILFVIAGYRKFAGGGVQMFVDKNIEAVPHYMPPWFGNVYLHAVPFAEVLFGALLVIGLLTRVSGLALALMTLSFTIAITGFKGEGSIPYHTNVLFIVLALASFLIGPGRFSLDAWLWGKRRAG